jgi:hypothetical protein
MPIALKPALHSACDRRALPAQISTAKGLLSSMTVRPPIVALHGLVDEGAVEGGGTDGLEGKIIGGGASLVKRTPQARR